jgi:hypothetical protein
MNITSFGFIILSPSHHFGRVRSTVGSIRSNHPGKNMQCVVPADTDEVDVKELSELCPVTKGGKSITSLINSGVKNAKSDWNILLMEGCYVRELVERKLFRFVESENDIIYPVMADYNQQGKPVKLYLTFDECSLNGITLHKNTFAKVGNFSENPLEISKLFWSQVAVDRGCMLKGVLGIKIC